ncbi:MAG: carbohydrate ABC transporter permease [Eubacteriales bacterium]|nr:carbohydrate ABC transporter permease [Eubacteriales bacterium]
MTVVCKQRKVLKQPDDVLRINQIKPGTNAFWTILMGIIAAVCILPIILVYIISFTSESSLIAKGYSFFPQAFSLDAYRYLFGATGNVLFASFRTTMIVTVTGTIFSMIISSLLAYVLSRPDYPYRHAVSFLVLFTMLFNGGLVPTYMVNTRILGLMDTIWVLILPMSINAFWIMILRTFFKSVPTAIIESARIDGAGELTTFLRIVVPLSKPGLATIGLFTVIQYWNDWFNGMLYVNTPQLTPLQTLLWSIQNNLEYLRSNAAMSAADMSSALANTPTDSARMAMTVLIITPMLFGYPFFQKYFVKGLTLGSVKE